MAHYVARERLYVTADRSRVVREDDAEAAFLLAGIGQEITEAEARRLGLIVEEAETKESAPAETKVIYPEDTKRKPKKSGK